MSIKLPMRGNPIRDLIDIEQLSFLFTVEELSKLPTIHKAARLADEFFQKHREEHGRVGRGTRINYLVLRNSGELQLVQFGPRGGHKVLWNFGNPLTTGDK